jgi:hypothetical protein
VRREVDATGASLTVGELRALLEGVDDAAPVHVVTALDDTLVGYTIDGGCATDLRLELVVEDVHAAGSW